MLVNEDGEPVILLAYRQYHQGRSYLPRSTIPANEGYALTSRHRGRGWLLLIGWHWQPRLWLVQVPLCCRLSRHESLGLVLRPFEGREICDSCEVGGRARGILFFANLQLARRQKRHGTNYDHLYFSHFQSQLSLAC